MKGADVVELMRYLILHKTLPLEHVSQDSTFTPEIEQAVKRFQRAKSIADDGKVGTTTVLLLKIRDDSSRN